MQVFVWPQPVNSPLGSYDEPSVLEWIKRASGRAARSHKSPCIPPRPGLCSSDPMMGIGPPDDPEEQFGSALKKQGLIYIGSGA
jgi:hypothetical protein